MKYVTKRFLDENDPEETGSIVCRASMTSYDELYRYSAENPSVDASIMVRDCYGKPVELEFSINAKSHTLADREAKLDMIIAELQAFKKALPKLYAQAKMDAAKWLADNPDSEEDKPRRRRSVTDLLGGE